MKKIFQSILPILIFACNNTEQTKGDIKKKDKEAFNVEIEKESPRRNNGTEFLLKFEDDTLVERMNVRYLDKRTLKFTLLATNKLRAKSSSLSGTATMDELKSGDPEEDESGDGVAFLYDNWHYIQGKCQLYMRIADSAKYIRIFEFNCQKLHEKYCSFESPGVLKRVDIE